MKLAQLVNYFRMGGSFEESCRSRALDLESEVVEIYIEKTLGMNNDLAFFEIEKTEGKKEFHFEDKTHVNLFDFNFFPDAIADSNTPENKSLSDTEIAKRLFGYAIVMHDGIAI